METKQINVNFDRSARKAIDKLARKNKVAATRIVAALEKYQANKDLLLVDAIRVTGTSNHRFRAGDYRVVFVFDDPINPTAINILDIGHRKDIYE